MKNQDEYNIYVSMLDEEDLDCLKYVQRLRKYTNKQLSVASPTDTDESKPEKKKRGRTKKVVGDNVVMSDPVTPEETSLPPSPA